MTNTTGARLTSAERAALRGAAEARINLGGPWDEIERVNRRAATPHTEGSAPDPRDITERLTEDERELLAALNRARNKELLKDGRTTYYSGRFAHLIETIAHLRGEVERLEQEDEYLAMLYRDMARIDVEIARVYEKMARAPSTGDDRK